MLRLLQWVFLGHVHKWKKLETRTINYNSTTIDGRTFKEQFDRVYCECERCGEPRHWDLRA